MFHNIWPKKEESVLDPVIAQAIKEMSVFDAESIEFKKASEALKTLVEAKAAEPKPKKLDVNTVAVIAANLTGIAMILVFEKTGGIITSKAQNFVMKPKS